MIKFLINFLIYNETCYSILICIEVILFFIFFHLKRVFIDDAEPTFGHNIIAKNTFNYMMDCQILLGMFLFHLKIFLFEKKCRSLHGSIAAAR